MDIYRILKNFDAVNSKQALDEGSIKQMLHKKAESMSKADFIAYVTGPESRSMTMSAKEAAEFWINCNGEDDEELDEATKSKEKEKKPPFPGSPEYEKKYGKPKHDDDSAFHKKKVSTGTVYSRKHKEEPEVDDEDDKPKKKGRPTGVKKKIGAKGPSVKSKLLTGKNKGGLKEHDHEHGMEMHMHNGPDSGEYDDEAGMARQDLHTVVDAARELHDILASDENLPEWVQAKITKALDYIDTSRDYIKSSHADQGEEEIDEAAGQQFKKGDPVTYGNHQMIFHAYDPQNPDYVYLHLPGQTATQAASLSGVKPAQPAQQAQQAQRFKKGDSVTYGNHQMIFHAYDPQNPDYVYLHLPGQTATQAASLSGVKPAGVAEASDDQLDQQKMSQMKRAAAARANSRRVQQQPPSGGPRRSDIPAGIRRARGDAPLGRDEMGEAAKWRDPDKEGKTWARDDASPPNDPHPGKMLLTKTGKRDIHAYADRGTGTASDPLAWKAAIKSAGKLTPSDVKFGTTKNFTQLTRDEMGETSMGGTVAGGMAPAPGAKTFAETSSGSHEIAWKAAAKAVNAIMKKRGYTGSKTDEGYMWTRKTPRGTAFVDIDFDERWPNEVRWGEGELKGAKRKDYYQSGNDNVRDLAQVIGELFANVKLGQSSMDEADEDGKKDKPGFGKKKPDDDGDGVPDWADKKPGSDDNEESDDSEESDEESDDDKELKLMKSRAGVEDKDEEDDKESNDDSEDDDSDDKPKKGKKPDFGKSDDEESDEDDSDDDEDDEKESDDDSDKEDKPKKDTSGTPYGKSVYESAFKKSLNSQLNESINMNTSQDSDGKKSVTVTASDEDADKLGELLKMAGLFSSEGYSSVCQNCGGIHEANACGADHVDEDLANSPDEMYTDADYMTQTLSGGLNGPKTTGQTTIPVINRQDSRQGVMAEADKITEQAKSRLWNMYKQYDKK
jgi:hypothetical protein